MKSSWQSQTGTLGCHWSEVGEFVAYRPAWLREESQMRGSYLEPIPDFASHSAFGGPDWFELHPAAHASKSVSYTHLTLPTICSV